MNPAILAVGSGILAAFGQIAMKYGVMEVAPCSLPYALCPSSMIGWLLRAFMNGFVLTGLFFYFLGACIWLLALQSGEISRIYPMVSISYVVVTIGGVVLFGEHITPFRAIGIALVCIGVTILWTCGIKI